MPQRVICHECRYILYEGIAFSATREIIHKHAGTCPKCNRQLSLLHMNVKVTPANK